MQKKINSRYNQASKDAFKDNPQERQKRVFGVSRSTNVPTKTVDEKPVMKKSVPIRKTKSSKPKENVPNPTIADSKRTRPNQRVKKDSETSGDKSSWKVTIIPQQDIAAAAAVIAPCTPMEAKPSSSKIKSNKAMSTPYHSAENCSKCRFDRLETSFYWLRQIKLAESVGKHFASVIFFKLAYESNAEFFSSQCL